MGQQVLAVRQIDAEGCTCGQLYRKGVAVNRETGERWAALRCDR